MDNTRYIFANIKQKTLNMSLRINYNITPDLTIQFWGQPFIATGDYSDFKYITDSKADKLSDRYYVYSENELVLNDDIYNIDENADGIADRNNFV